MKQPNRWRRTPTEPTVSKHSVKHAGFKTVSRGLSSGDRLVWAYRRTRISGLFQAEHAADSRMLIQSSYTTCSHGSTKTWSGKMLSPLAASCFNRKCVKASMRR